MLLLLSLLRAHTLRAHARPPHTPKNTHKNNNNLQAMHKQALPGATAFLLQVDEVVNIAAAAKDR